LSCKPSPQKIFAPENVLLGQFPFFKNSRTCIIRRNPLLRVGEIWRFYSRTGLAYHPGRTVNADKTLTETGGNDV
jgi:hypothetical protein